MPARFQFTPRAVDNLDEIWGVIAQDSIAAANRVESAILAACGKLAARPLLGSRRNEVTPLPVRFWTVTRFPNFIVVYRPDTTPLQIVAVLHGKRNIKTLLEEPGTL
jgi:plasmid stabilization system protein ParE